MKATARKTREVPATTKARILEAYLNLASFRGELQGIAAASQALFGKSPHGLTLDESVLLAALLPFFQSPSPPEGGEGVLR